MNSQKILEVVNDITHLYQKEINNVVKMMLTELQRRTGLSYLEPDGDSNGDSLLVCNLLSAAVSSDIAYIFALQRLEIQQEQE